MNKVVFQNNKTWEKIIEHGLATVVWSYQKIDVVNRFTRTFHLIRFHVCDSMQSARKSRNAWHCLGVLLYDGDVEMNSAVCKGLGWRSKDLWWTPRTWTWRNNWRCESIWYWYCSSKYTFKKLQEIIKFYRDDAKVFFDNLKLYITRKKNYSPLWDNWSSHIAWLFDIDSFQYTMTPSNQLLEIEVFKRRYLIGRQIIDFDESNVLDYKRNQCSRQLSPWYETLAQKLLD